MKKSKRFACLVALCLIASVILGMVPASAGGIASLREQAIGRSASVRDILQAKNTTRLAPPKSLKLKVGEVKRVNLKLKYKIQPDRIGLALDRTDRILPFTHNNDLFVMGLDTGDATMILQSGVKNATMRLSVTPMPVTGIRLQGDLLQLNQYAITNLNQFVVPAVAIGQVKWSSDRPKVVKVTAKGELTCKKRGNAVITCKTKKGSQLVGSILVTVD